MLLCLYSITFYFYCPHRSFHSRMFFLCPVCKKAPHSLPGHLRKVCMRHSTEAEIQAVVIEAKKELSEFCHRGRFWEFEKNCDILDSTNPLARFVTPLFFSDLKYHVSNQTSTNIYILNNCLFYLILCSLF